MIGQQHFVDAFQNVSERRMITPRLILKEEDTLNLYAVM